MTSRLTVSTARLVCACAIAAGLAASDGVIQHGPLTHPQETRLTDASADGGRSAAEIVLDNYDAALSIFPSAPELWGGAYVDGEELVVRFANQSAGEAEATLARAGADTNVRLVRTDISLAMLDHAMEVLSPALASRSEVVSFGPDYMDSAISIDVEGSGDEVSKLAQRLSEDVPIRVRAHQHRPST